MGGAGGSRDALLIATGAYRDQTLRPLRSPRQDAAGLAEVLEDPRIGGFRTQQVLDKPSHQVARALERFFSDRIPKDLLLLHLSCHGIKDDRDGHLYFATPDTEMGLLASTSIPAAFLHDQMKRCRAATIVVLLDCCYSGAFLPGVKSDGQVHVQDELSGRGRAILTATNSTEYAWQGNSLETADPQPSQFTGMLIKGLRGGAADLDGDGKITVTELYYYVYEHLRRTGVRQSPRMWADLEYQVTIARAAPKAASASSASGRHHSVPRDAASSKRQTAAVGTPPGSSPHTRSPRGRDAVIKLEVTLEEAAFGALKEVEVETAVVCTVCEGQGTAVGVVPVICSTCRGSGQATEHSSMGGTVTEQDCSYCNGFGTLLPRLCRECRGEGRIRKRRKISLQVPAGVDTGIRIQRAGEGEVGPRGGAVGDLYVEIVMVPDGRFTRYGADLHSTINIPRQLAIYGGTTLVATLYGQKTVRIPPGIREGKMLRLSTFGMPQLGGGRRGDLLVRLDMH